MTNKSSTPIQTVHGVSSPMTRGASEIPKQDSDDTAKEKRPNSTQLYRDETAERLEEHNKSAGE
ncbi:hypothetical protein SAMN06265222_1345 [Neorhodopirellula lusitana]|uniref:Uncharacterized protein n=2 Tax=Neorhodopirellula lusitana TaxID=445327 RepID=A0ABY1QUQ3_9BACT|nr:hypothetical protein SAMN06265222_1345 [Neorhodopirellula lusitana]